MEKKPLISFIVTVYNLEKYIARCLDSILNQDFDDYEIVVVDNASTDSSSEICRKYSEKRPDKIRFYQVEKEIARMGTAHQLGYGVTHGEYLQFIDGDDRLSKNCLKEIAEVIMTKQPDVVMGKFECYLEEGFSNKFNYNDAKFDKKMINDQPYDDALVYLSTLANFQGVIWRYIFKRSLTERNYKNTGLFVSQPFFARLSTDVLMQIGLLYRANSIYYIDRAIYLYTRRVDGSGAGYLAYDEMSKDSIVAILNALFILFAYQPLGAKRIFVINRIYFLFKFFKFGLNYVNDEILKGTAKIINENIVLLDLLNECGIDELQLFYDFIKQKNSYKGLCMYKEHIESNFLKKLEAKKNDRLFIFPGGNKTMAALKLLKENGYSVEAILDNDTKKHLHKYKGLICQSPEVIKKMDLDEKTA